MATESSEDVAADDAMDIDTVPAPQTFPDHDRPEQFLASVAIGPSGWLTNSCGDSISGSDGEPVLIPSCKELIDTLGPGPEERYPTDAELTSDEWLSNLHPVDNLYDLATRALNDIEKMGAPPIKRKDGEGRRGKRSMRANKIRQLEDSQKRRLQKDGNSGAALSASLRCCMAFNSIRAILNLLLPMMTHSRRNDGGLVMANGKKLNNSDKKRCYLLGTNAYSITTAKGFGVLNKHLGQIVCSIASQELYQRIRGDVSLAKDHLLPSLFCPTCDSVDGIIDCTLGIFLGSDGPAVRAKALAAKVDAAFIAPLTYSDPHLQQKHRASIDRLLKRLDSAVHAKYRGAQLTVYGSCLSRLTLGPSSDVDISLHLPEALRLKQDFDAGRIKAEMYEKGMKNIVFKVKHAIEGRGFVDLFAVHQARIPVVKGRFLDARSPHSADGSASFDVCFLNDIAVTNSSLLGEYSQVDSRVRQLMLAVKSWVKANKIGSAADGTLSSYTWVILVIFYLQSIEFVPNLQSEELMKAHGIVPDPHSNPDHGVNGLNTAFLPVDILKKARIWKANKRVARLPVTSLLYGFFKFYAGVFPQSIAAVSVRLGTCTLLKTSFSRSAKVWRICIEDPFETYYSHCPHDLGVHMEQKGQWRIESCLQEAVLRMESNFDGERTDDDAVLDISKLVKGDRNEEECIGPPTNRSKGHQDGGKEGHLQNTRGQRGDGRRRHRNQTHTRRPEQIHESTAPKEQNGHDRGGGRDGGRGSGRGSGRGGGHSSGRGSGRSGGYGSGRGSGSGRGGGRDGSRGQRNEGNRGQGGRGRGRGGRRNVPSQAD